jgi:hypothetical protein
LRLKNVGEDVLLSDTVADFDALAVDVNDDSFRILPLSSKDWLHDLRRVGVVGAIGGVIRADASTPRTFTAPRDRRLIKVR